MFKLIKFKADHLYSIVDQEINKDFRSWCSLEYFKRLEEGTDALTGVIDDKIMICFGIAVLWNRRGYLWTVLSEDVKQHSTSVYRSLKQFLEEQTLYDRIEMDVPINMDIAHKRARFLGFHEECHVARRFSPRGEDRSLYSWTRSF